MACQSKKVLKYEESKAESPPFTLGIDNFVKNHLTLVKGKRVGLLTNPSGVNGQLQATADILYHHPEVNLTTLFGPEHGIRGAIHAGEHVTDTVDNKTSIPIYSLYGKSRRPSPEMLENIDVIIIDIQDFGLRAYTYIYTMAKVMEAAAEYNKQVLVLDRPNPLGGIRVEGNLVEEGYFSFVGLYPIPYQHGMSIGELAQLFNDAYGIDCQLVVIPMLGWKREMLWGATGLSWVPISPHVPHWKTILHMGATGTIGELRVLSEGVGYTSPFEIVGAPWIDAEEFAKHLNELKLPGVYFRPLYFHPYYATYQGEICQGVQLHIQNPDAFSAYSTGLYIMQIHMKLYPEKDLFREKDRISMFDKVVGTDKIRKMLIDEKPVAYIVDSWSEALEQFKISRKKYLIYN